MISIKNKRSAWRKKVKGVFLHESKEIQKSQFYI